MVHQLLIAKLSLKLKKAGKTTRPSGYDLNQIPHEYIAEVMNRFRGLDLANRVPEELQTELHDAVQKAVTKTTPKKKKSKKAKWLSEEALQIAEVRESVPRQVDKKSRVRRMERNAKQGREERYIQLKAASKE